MISLFQPSLPEPVVEPVAATLRVGWLSEGRQIKASEEAFCRQFALSRELALNSGIAAVQLAILGAGDSPGDEVVIPAQTFVPTGTAGWRHWLPGIAQAQRIQTPAREIARFHCGPTAPRCFFDREASVEEMGRAIPQGGEDLTPSLIGASRVFQNRIKQSTQAVPR